MVAIPVPRRPADAGTTCVRHPRYFLASCGACQAAHTARLANRGRG